MILKTLWKLCGDRIAHQRMNRLIWIGVILFFCGAFLELTWELHEDVELAWDNIILIWVGQHRMAALNGSAVDVTALGSPAVITLFALLGILALGLRRAWAACLFLAIGSAGAGLITFALKHVFSRPRPDVVPHLVEVQSYSYPSGHSLAGTAFYLTVMFLGWSSYPSWIHRLYLTVAALFLIVGISFSRIYLGVHYPSDVLAGNMLSASWACFLASLFFGKAFALQSPSKS